MKNIKLYHEKKYLFPIRLLHFNSLYYLREKKGEIKSVWNLVLNRDKQKTIDIIKYRITIWRSGVIFGKHCAF